ncbi:LCP family protein [Cellulomonas sp. KRMCY2]|uniref:LCP family protein n=1 Tax=Cellulomonas sp. KRMCY2 TaxID=1304865 RepID=UPI000688268A|nr:LCP family protein [Cellulomonas sp. KRMCY2]
MSDQQPAETTEPAEGPSPLPAEPRRRRFRDRTLLFTLTIVLTVLVVGATVAAGMFAIRLNGNLERIADPFVALPSRPSMPAPTPDEAGDLPADTAMNLLVLGSDSRVSAGDPGDWEQGAQRTDAIMLVHIPADNSAAYVMSIPRDSWVDIPGHGMAKINAAYSYGGPALLIETMEQLTDVRIDHLAIADFESFTELTDAIGGVRMTLKEDLVDHGTLILPAGEHQLTGEQALTYVRQRKNLARGDFDRVQRQQAWVRAIMDKVRNDGVLTSPNRLTTFLDTATRSVAVDEGFSVQEMLGIGNRVKGLASADVQFFTVPIEGIGTSADGQSIVLLDEAPFDTLMAAVRDDALAGYLAEHADDVDTLPDVAP